MLFRSFFYTAFLFCSFLSSEALCKKLSLFFNEEDCLTVKVIKDGSIRISIEGDRIQEVIGLDESISFEKNETSGFLYLRNLDKKQSITIVTEGGVLQDLILEPSDKGFSNIVLKSKKSDSLDETTLSQATQITRNLSGYINHTLLPNPTFQDAAIMLMKHMYACSSKTEDIEHIEERQTAYGVTAKPLNQMKAQGLVGTSFEITNCTKNSINLLEKDFYRLGDFALGLGKSQLEVGEKTLLLVVSKG